MEQNQNRRHVFQFFETLAARRNLSSTQVRIRLARKISERSKLVKQRKNIKRRLRLLAKSLETKEAEIILVEEEIQQLERNVQDGTDQSSSEED